VDAAGAEQLRRRLEQQAHWRQAEAVRDGDQPACDPDAHDLEEIGERTRYYTRDRQRLTVDGRPAIVTFRTVKNLVDGRWELSIIREDVEYAS
jgi:hypothetical protein